MTKMNHELRGHVALVSGGLGDIGRAVAHELAARGADVALGDVAPPTAAEAALAALGTIGVRAAYAQVDVSDAAAVQGWIADVERTLGVPTLVVANAAQVTQADFRSLTAEQWARELRVNLDGAFHVAHAAGLRMLARGARGRIVFLGSWAADHPHRTIPAYCVAKAGLRMLCRCMALEFAPHGILVNEVAPGIVDAGLSGRIMREDPALREKLLGLAPAGSLVTAAEVARAVALLCGPDASQMVGSTLLLDGGMSLLPPGD
jgi:glucose 1-dehydrogenase